MLRKIATLPLAVVVFAGCGEAPTNGAAGPDLPPPAPPSRHVSGENGPAGSHPELLPVITAPASGATEAPGAVTLSWNAGTDRDLQNFRYRVECSGDGCTPVAETLRSATMARSLSVNLTPGTYTFYIRGEKTNGSGLHGSAYATRTFNVSAPPPTKQSQSITWQPIADRAYGDVFEIASLASASSGLPVSLASVTPSVCALGPIDTPHTHADQVRMVGVGTCTIRARQTGNDDFFPADDADVSFAVGQKALVASAVATPATKVYDGQGFDTGTFSVSYDGFVNGDDAGDLEGTPEFAVLTPAGESHTLPNAGTYELHVSGLSSPNYSISYRSTPVTIERATPTIVFTIDGPYTYDGTARSATGVVKGVGGVDLGAATIAYDGSATAPVNAGVYTVTGSYAGSANYKEVTGAVGGELVIEKASLTVTADDKEKVFDGQPFPGPFTARYDGFVNDEGVDVLTGTLSFTGAARTATSVGEHVIEPQGLTAANYKIRFLSGTLTIHAWRLTGFYQPVAMSPSSGPVVYNTVKGGSTVPLKFEIFAATQVGINEQTSTAAVKSFVAVKVACATNAFEDDLDFTTTGGTTLRYDSVAGQFIQNWQTPRLAGHCYKVTMTAADGSTLEAYFRLK